MRVARGAPGLVAGGLDVEQAGAILRVQLEADGGNLFTHEMTTQLAALLRTPPDGVHVVHLSAAGEAFCLGRAPFRTGVDELAADVQGLHGLNQALGESPAVIVTEVHGDAAGFGVGIVALSDVAIASPEARLSFPEVDAGFAPALVLSWLVPLVGRQVAFWLTATGARIPAREAKRIGLLTEVAADATSLEGTTGRAIDELLSKPPAVHRDIKRLMRYYAGLPETARGEVAASLLDLGALRRAVAG